MTPTFSTKFRSATQTTLQLFSTLSLLTFIGYYLRYFLCTILAVTCNKSFIIRHPARTYPTLISLPWKIIICPSRCDAHSVSPPLPSSQMNLVSPSKPSPANDWQQETHPGNHPQRSTDWTSPNSRNGHYCRRQHHLHPQRTRLMANQGRLRGDP